MISRLFIAALITTVMSVGAKAQTANDPAVSACKATGLLALKEKSKDITDLVIDVESVAVSKADTKVEDVAIKTVVLGEAYIAAVARRANPTGSSACSAKKARCC